MTSYLYSEIMSQPDILTNFLDTQSENIAKIAQSIRDFNPHFVVIAARGTSDNAARYAQYMLGIQVGLPVSLAAPSIHTLYDQKPNMSGGLVIGISQSGRSEDVRQVLEDAREQGAITLAITNFDDSPLALTAKHHINLCAGEEKSVAATKTYTTELATIALLTQHLTRNEDNLNRLMTLPSYMQQTLDLAVDMDKWVQRYCYTERIAVVGRGYNYATAFEISLKIKELCYIVGEQYSEADFRHGPIAIISQGFPVIAVAPEGKTQALMIDLLQKLNEKQADCIVISNSLDICQLGRNSVQLPANIPEWLSPICAVLPGQLFAYHLAKSKGFNVDQPRGLKKVTITK